MMEPDETSGFMDSSAAVYGSITARGPTSMISHTWPDAVAAECREGHPPPNRRRSRSQMHATWSLKRRTRDGTSGSVERNAADATRPAAAVSTSSPSGSTRPEVPARRRVRAAAGARRRHNNVAELDIPRTPPHLDLPRGSNSPMRSPVAGEPETKANEHAEAGAGAAPGATGDATGAGAGAGAGATPAAEASTDERERTAEQGRLRDKYRLNGDGTPYDLHGVTEADLRYLTTVDHDPSNHSHEDSVVRERTVTRRGSLQLALEPGREFRAASQGRGVGALGCVCTNRNIIVPGDLGSAETSAVVKAVLDWKAEHVWLHLFKPWTSRLSPMRNPHAHDDDQLKQELWLPAGHNDDSLVDPHPLSGVSDSQLLFRAQSDWPRMREDARRRGIALGGLAESSGNAGSYEHKRDLQLVLACAFRAYIRGEVVWDHALHRANTPLLAVFEQACLNPDLVVAEATVRLNAYAVKMLRARLRDSRGGDGPVPLPFVVSAYQQLRDWEPPQVARRLPCCGQETLKAALLACAAALGKDWPLAILTLVLPVWGNHGKCLVVGVTVVVSMGLAYFSYRTQPQTRRDVARHWLHTLRMNDWHTWTTVAWFILCSFVPWVFFMGFALEKRALGRAGLQRFASVGVVIVVVKVMCSGAEMFLYHYRNALNHTADPSISATLAWGVNVQFFASLGVFAAAKLALDELDASRHAAELTVVVGGMYLGCYLLCVAQSYIPEKHLRAQWAITALQVVVVLGFATWLVVDVVERHVRGGLLAGAVGFAGLAIVRTHNSAHFLWRHKLEVAAQIRGYEAARRELDAGSRLHILFTLMFVTGVIALACAQSTAPLYICAKIIKAIPYGLNFVKPPKKASGSFKTFSEFKFILHVVEMAIVTIVYARIDSHIDRVWGML